MSTILSDLANRVFELYSMCRPGRIGFDLRLASVLPWQQLRGPPDVEDRRVWFSASKDGEVVFDRPLLEVAEDLGLTHAAYYRALAALARSGSIKRTGRTIQITRALPA